MGDLCCTCTARRLRRHDLRAAADLAGGVPTRLCLAGVGAGRLHRHYGCAPALRRSSGELDRRPCHAGARRCSPRWAMQRRACPVACLACASHWPCRAAVQVPSIHWLLVPYHAPMGATPAAPRYLQLCRRSGQGGPACRDLAAGHHDAVASCTVGHVHDRWIGCCRSGTLAPVNTSRPGDRRR